MAYKILYLEDLDPGSIIHDLNGQGFKVEYYKPVNFEETIKEINDYDLLLLDFRLTETTVIFDAPTIAQTVRTINSVSHKDIPIVLISSETKISDFYKDLTSQDLFDLSIAKDTLLNNLEKYSKRFKSLICSYKKINAEAFNVSKILQLSGEETKNIDYRIFEKLEGEVYSNDVFAFSSFILNNLIRAIGPLIGEDVLSARLGISKSSKDWGILKSHFDEFKYKGVFSDSYNRWWSDGLLNWWKGHNEGKNTLRKLNAEQRLKRITEITALSLSEQPLSKYAKSKSYWTICKETQLPIDPIDGLELHKKDLLAWQEKEYLSIQAGLEPQKFDSSTGKPVYIDFLKPIEKNRLKTIAKSL